jgi:glycosyltransferase involved in cell wall biosynthesis
MSASLPGPDGERREPPARGGALVSVVIPCYNGDRYLAAAIESALGQTYRPIEVIVVDDGSTDRSREVVEAFGRRVQYAYRIHSGIAGARNHGADLARGGFLAFLDADDLWTEDKLQRQMAAFESDATAGIVIGDTDQFVSPELPDEVRARFVTGTVAVRLPGAVLIRRAAFDRVGNFSTDLVSAEFMDWIVRANALGVKSVQIPGVVLRRRIHTTNHGILRRDAQGDYLRVVKAALDRRRESAPTPKTEA